MAFEYKAKDGVPRYAKFRLVPADGREETGLMTEYDQRKPWQVIHHLVYVIYQTRERVFHQDIQTPRSGLKKRGATEFF